MNVTVLMQEIYKVLINDETLLRYLHYLPKNQIDNPLSESKSNILDLPPEQKFDIINELVFFMDKHFKLDLKPKYNRVNFYLGERKPERVYSSGAGKLVNNPYVSKQEIVIDIHTEIKTNMVDMRMYLIIDRINSLIMNRDVKQFLELKFEDSYTITQTPDGFIGFRMVYYTLSSQVNGCE